MEQVVIGRLLRELRGDNTQKGMSEALGVAADKYYKWEAGYSILLYSDFVNICEFQKVDIRGLYYQLFNFRADNLGQKEVLDSLITHWWFSKESEIPAQLTISKSKWRRLRNGESSLSFRDFLRIVEIITGHSTDFLNFFPGCIQNHTRPEVAPEDVIEVLRTYPEFASIISATKLEAFKFCKGDSEQVDFLQRATRLSSNYIREIIAFAESKNILMAQNQWESAPFKTALAKCDMSINDRMSKDLLERHHRIYVGGEANRDIIRSVPIYAAVTKESIRNIHLTMEKCMHEIGRIIAADQLKEKDELIQIILSADNSQISKTEP